MDLISTPDGRRLEYAVSGPDDGLALLFHTGTPSAVVPYPPLDRQVEEHGLRMVTYSRPGYGGSMPRPDDGRIGTMADDVADSMTILDALGIDDFVTLGWSGGGPRALACAALRPDRCRAAASLAGAAPYGPADLDYVADMGLENVRDILAALLGREMLRPFIEAQVAELSGVTGADLVAAFGGLVDEVDAAALTDEYGEWIAAEFRRATEQSAVGLLEDSMQLVQPWGFDLASITVPVSVWQGRHDKMVPFGHGIWLAEHIPGARAHLFDDEGHISLVGRLGDILADLKDVAGA
jgi:pimeloyl-ACP methyl ester carboxylesterase